MLSCCFILYSFNTFSFFQLPQGTLIQVSPSIVKRCKTHYHNLPCGATVILGNNGYIWIGQVMSQQDLSVRGSERKEEVKDFSPRNLRLDVSLILTLFGDKVSNLQKFH